jgi:hypothetical protein
MGAIVIWDESGARVLLRGLDRGSLRRAADQLRAATGWPKFEDVRRARRTGVTSARKNRIDFREEAVAACRAAIAGHERDLASAGASLCVPAPGNPVRIRRVLAMVELLVGFTALAGLLAGFIVIPLLGAAGLLRWHQVNGVPVFVWAAVATALIGLVTMRMAVSIRNVVFLRWLRSQTAIRRFMPPGPPVGVVSIEDPATASRLKVVMEDLAAIFPDPERQLVLLEGFSHRYAIRAEDLLEYYSRVFFIVPGVVIAFRVGGSDQVLRLKLAQVIPTGKRDKSGRPWSPLPDTLQNTFGVAMSERPR